MEIIYKTESYRIMGACFEVYNAMGCGFLEGVYQECLARELFDQGIPHVAQPELGLMYKDKPLVQTFKPDFILYDSIVLEIKALSELTDICRAQLHNYLKVTKYRLGLLVNFGHHPKLESERIIR